jgi:hypothetical protein
MRKKRRVPQAEKITRILAHSARKEKPMKKYRLTKITVKTREIISVAKTAATGNEDTVCPVCRAPLPVFLPAAGAAAEVDLLNDFLERNLKEEK